MKPVVIPLLYSKPYFERGFITSFATSLHNGVYGRLGELNDEEVMDTDSRNIEGILGQVDHFAGSILPKLKASIGEKRETFHIRMCKFVSKILPHR